MKKLFTLLALSMLFLVSCSEDSAVEYNNESSVAGTSNLAARSAAWNGVIGIEENGVYKITADAAALKADLEDILRSQGYSVTLQSLKIVEKHAGNNTADIGYMLVGADMQRTSIGLFLVKQNNQFSDMNGPRTTCSGCPQGCNLSYLLIDGKKIAYCNENGCDYDCTQSTAD